MLTLANFINGSLVPPSSGKYLDSFEPASGAPHARVPDSTEADINAAVDAARAAFPSWAATPASERSRLLLRLADLLDSNLERIAAAESADTGKPISLARAMDAPRSATNFRFFATAILHSSSEFHESELAGVPANIGNTRSLHYTLRKPRGVAGLISPWNLPLYLLTWKIAPALATGNTAVCKPSEVTPVTAHLLAELAQQAGLPSGVLNIVHGKGPNAGAALVTHADVPTISFTGSTLVGRWIGRECGDRLKRVSLELGGKNPFIVFSDANLPAALAAATAAGFTNQGQVCLCGSRLLIHDSIYDQFVPEFTARIQSLRSGDPSDPATQQGALTSAEHLAKVESYVDLARQLGGRILCGGARISPSLLPARCKSGYFFAPTLIEGLDPACRVEQEEIFGPVVTLQRFKSDEEALSLANSTPYGLAATIFTQSLPRAHRMAADLQSGLVWVNSWLVRDLRTPFGGAKQSGVGREGGTEALKFFTEASNICIGL